MQRALSVAAHAIASTSKSVTNTAMRRVTSNSALVYSQSICFSLPQFSQQRLCGSNTIKRERSFDWHRRYPLAMHELKILGIDKNDDDAKDREEKIDAAFDCVLEAAESGFADAQYCLGQTMLSNLASRPAGGCSQSATEGGEPPSTAREVVQEIKDMRKKNRKKKKAALRGAKEELKSLSEVEAEQKDVAPKPATLKDVRDAASSEEATNMKHREAARWFTKAAEKGHAGAMVQLGNMSLSGQAGQKQDVESALKWYTKGSDNEHPDASYNLGQLYYDGVDGVLEPDRERAALHFRKAADAGDLSANFFLGHMYRVGEASDGISFENELGDRRAHALKFLHVAADAEEDGAAIHPSAAFYLAQLYRSGDEDMALENDNDKFQAYLEKAVLGKDADAAFCLADILFHGLDGFTPNRVEAVKYYKLAASQDHADALFCLGVMHFNGIIPGCTLDYEMAFECYQKSAEAGSTEALRSLATMYAAGIHVKKCKDTAKHFIDIADRMESEVA